MGKRMLLTMNRWLRSGGQATTRGMLVETRRCHHHSKIWLLPCEQVLGLRPVSGGVCSSQGWSMTSTSTQKIWMSSMAGPNEIYLDDDDDDEVDVDSFFVNHRNNVNELLNERDKKDDDMFQILGLPRSFTIDEEQLQEAYRKLMMEYHPDKHTLQPMETQKTIGEKAAQVTNAYQILKEPHTRATHLLTLKGYWDTTEQEGTTTVDADATHSLVKDDFLFEVMEWREEIETNANNQEQLQHLWNDCQQELDRVIEDLSLAFSKEDYQQAKELTAQLQYWHRIETAIYEKMDTK